LALERLLERQPYAVIRGQGGVGKTTIAVELARWLVRSRRFDRCAFVSVEEYSHDRAVLDVLGKQLVGDTYSVAEYGDDLDKALQPLLRELENFLCLIVVDNLESLLGDDAAAHGVFELLEKLLTPSPQPLSLTGRGALNGGTARLPSTSGRGAGGEGASLLFTTREPLPEPFNHNAREITLGALSQTDAKALVLQVMNNQGLDLRHDDLGNDPAEVNALVDAVGGHARALVLLARELAIKGVAAATENVRGVMQDLHRRHPGERELSLFASVELSLRHLSEEVRAEIAGLAVFQDGGRIQEFEHVLFEKNSLWKRMKNFWKKENTPVNRTEQTTKICNELIQAGLAQTVGDYGYVRFDPALPAYLALGLDAAALAEYRARWVAVMEQLVGFLYQQIFQDTKLAFSLTQLELPNLMAYLQGLMTELVKGEMAAEPVVDKLGSVETLLANLNQAQALTQVVAWLEQAAQGLGEWSHSSYQNKDQNIDRLLQQGDVQGAYQAAEALLRECQQAGEQAYAGADFDLAMAHFNMGRVLRMGGAAEAALAYLQQAQQRFEALGERGARMASVALTEQGDCLQALGQLEAAAGAYEEKIKRAEKLEDTRQVTVGKELLATTRMLQKRYDDALSGYQEALASYEELGEPGAVATSWHQMGMTYKEMGEYAQAEQAYRQSMAIESQQGNRADEALS
jgi:tetratricopeptide (TPR) repeat protein